ncbi:branched-chain amino acid ABC transporter permease [Dactylosporangium sp. NPDC005572]|uniref:branched-chain amino acid ABC transporter permease n=1 Tax=Dactylosporangium sp. NPDC005572 TaxID=3156889 RepID=UPI0033BE2134
MADELIIALDGLALGLLLYCVATGLSLALGVAGVFQLSHGAFFLAGTCMAWWLAESGSWLGFFAALAAGLVSGGVAGGGLAVLLRPLTNHLDQVLATIGIGLVLVDLLTTGHGAQPRSVQAPPGLDRSVVLLGHAYPTYRLVVIVVAAALAVLLYLTVEASRAGALVRAVAADAGYVATLGVEPRRAQLLVMAAGGALATGTGVLGAPILGPAPGLDSSVLTLSLIIVVAGGLGSMRGSLAAALLVGQIQTTAAVAWPLAAPFLLLVLLVVGLVWRARRTTAGIRVT